MVMINGEILTGFLRIAADRTDTTLCLEHLVIPGSRDAHTFLLMVPVALRVIDSVLTPIGINPLGISGVPLPHR